ncbi:hydrogenase nickel incorporation protein HypB [Parageobacillus thermoglucosidasius]|uniref:Hydrogenase accessory protein HypB n=2 Tax=Anoxybacillaceae TaxID=3120669 RepID=A0AAN0YP41_PARTM|nr:hydrogenase nickel incorporation protein HypB [Parageobacillus thermoglucosidasius]REK54203.1 MAG: hydrogenase accessory protein HypB [Geobacillus sp.]AEH48042.1 hydrogenase accessory protein HypB [Parageobacillus thermoglucosidasius C56-YS93]ALF10725.1 hydrogenase accessory protein HypB [Parageobacillus thermoglucosidasius]ANZ30803.1 hydrogenase accessory protein HypB [Parageobacillus thermoglucosidasius]APM81540.1 hydrogenase accessory protein HypB [Parageobacillus thermoglucosidasius]
MTELNPRIVEIRQNVLKKNDLLARELRKRFQKTGVYVVNLVSSPGAGKTTLLTEALTRLGRRHQVAALVGDLATENDADRLRQSGAKVRQITTGTVCHLEAEMIERALQDWDLEKIDFLFIENVGNLVCPASYDLGENQRVVLFSVTEGEDKPVKYPTIVNSADAAIITKIDLAEAVGFQRNRFYEALHEVRPDIRIYEVSARTGEGIDEWISRLEADKSAFLMSSSV